MKFLATVLATAMGLALVHFPAVADDGERIVRSVSNPKGLELDPEPEGEHAFIKMMNFHVPAQSASGDLMDGIVSPAISYLDIDGVEVKTEVKAKPLINVYVFGPVTGFDTPETSGFSGHGRRDAFGAVSLDDGETWKVTNLSNSADQSSFVVSTPLQDPGVAVGEGSSIVFDENGPTLESVAWKTVKRGGKLSVLGDTGIASRERVEIRNAVTQDTLFTFKSTKTGDFEKTRRLAFEPCYVQAGVDGVFGPAIAVEGVSEECVGPDSDGSTLITDYPGDVPNVFHAVAGNRVLVAWHSKFCSKGNPVWGDSFPRDELADYLGIDSSKDLYLTDLFGAAGSQGTTNYNELDAEPVGEVPYSCLWSARGVLREDPEALGSSQMVWFQAERLTSGVRDVNRVETACIAGAGCAISWQEDPEGVRPGEGEGPGTGWSGATTASKTDIWYSFINWEDFDIIDISDDEDTVTPAPLANNIAGTGRPVPYVPMMSPVRLTNNNRCSYPITTDTEDSKYDSYCNDAVAGAYGIVDQCVGSIEVPLGHTGKLQSICVVDSNQSGVMDAGDMPNIANTAASRPRLNLQPRDSNGDGNVDDAWVIIVSEEDKGLGSFGFSNREDWNLGDLTDTADPLLVSDTCHDDPPQQPDEETGCQKADVGKNVFWTSFAMGSPKTSENADEDFSLVSNLLDQGAQLNQPEVNWRTGSYYPPMNTADMWDLSDADVEVDLNYLIFNSEIARRTSLMSQPVTKATAGGTQDGLVAMPLWKQGIVNQGGPADITTRRIVAPAEVDETTENPYAASNMVCAWYDGLGEEHPGVVYFDDGTNPYYPDGLCMAAPINLSARTPHTCSDSGEESDGVCPGATDESGLADMTCTYDEQFGQLCSSLTNPEDNQAYDKLLSWYECPGWNGTNVSNDATDGTPGACGSEPISVLLGSNRDDQSWYNPLEVAKAHRGFLDGNHIMMIYAWSPNWKLNTKGKDRYELFTRRSFDGGVTWTTTPGSFIASNGISYSGQGTTTCETMRDGEDSKTDTHLCTRYGAGDPEQSRNVSQLTSMKSTILDPRYTAAGGIPPKGITSRDDIVWGIFEAIEPTDILNPSRNFVVYEDGDNTTVEFGEAEPLNLSYSRADLFGDNFTVWSELGKDGTTGLDDCYPNNTHGDEDANWAAGTGFCNEFDTMEGFHDALSEEASITASPDGDFLYGVWGQFNVDDDGEFTDGDSMFRRIWYLDGYISADEGNSYTLPGTKTDPVEAP